MNQDLNTDGATAVAELIDRERIRQCLLRQARGMDRLDRDLALSAYHEDAVEDHGALIAPCATFVDQVLEFHRQTELSTQHVLVNHSCDIDGDIAHAETYTHCYSVLPSGMVRIAFGRFVDRLEKRDGRWGIVSRVSMPEGAIEAPRFDDRVGMVNVPGSLVAPARDRSDPSYLRPLPVSRG